MNMNMKDKELIASKIEEHISMLVAYDVIEAQVGDTLSEYVWAIVLGDQNAEDSSPLAPVRDLKVGEAYMDALGLGGKK
jgi:hypothetical protein